MFKRFRREFPLDPRLAATNETAQTWDRIIRVDRAIAVFRGGARTAGKVAGSVAKRAGLGDSDDGPTFEAPERGRQVTPHEWSGPAELIVGHTSPSLRAGQPLHRRFLKSHHLTGFPDGWLRASAAEVAWEPSPSSTRSEQVSIVKMPAPNIVDLELFPIGRHSAGLTVTGADDDQLWLFVPDRRKLDEMALRLRYGDRS